MKEQVPWWKKGACVWSQQICCTLCFHATEPQSFISNRRTMITVSLSRARGYGRCSTHHIEEWTVGPTVLPPTPMIPPPPPHQVTLTPASPWKAKMHGPHQPCLASEELCRGLHIDAT